MKVLIVGLGSIAKKHINALFQLDGTTQIFALRNSTNSIKVLGVTDIYSLDEIDMTEIDFVLISNPTSEHFSTIKQLVTYNKSLFIEKPLFSVLNNETEELVARIEKQNLHTYVACNLRFLDSIKELKKLLVKTRVNEVNVYCGSFLPDWRPELDFRTVYSANKEMGGGVHIDLIHELDYVYWLFGMPQETQSYFANKSSLNISAFDYANYLWSYKQFSASIILNYYRKESKRTIEVITDSEILIVDLLNNTIRKDNVLIFKSDQKIIDTYCDQMQFFIKNIINGKQQFNTISEANSILKLCMQD